MHLDAPVNQLAVDVGGTFTDFVLTTTTGATHTHKTPTTRADPSEGILQGIDEILKVADVAPSALQRFIHGTTVATNAVIERRGARVGLLTTKGFADVLEIGRQFRTAVYDVILSPETPVFVAPGRYRKDIPERVDSKGSVISPLDEGAVVDAVGDLVDAGVSSIAIAFLFSFLNPLHERTAKALIEKHFPGLPVSLSSEVDPAFREYERTLATAFDAYVKPVVDEYLQRLAGGLAAKGISAPMQIMQSRGGLNGWVIARQRPIRLFLSGPAGGVVGGLSAGSSCAISNIITLDIGGTSSDIALIAGGTPQIKPEGVIGGYSVRVPMVDVNAIGAGGGSVAWIDPAGALKVGPHSAGSEPGPACYGRGGQNATVTDASLVLGYLDPGYFLGGALSLDPELADSTVRRQVGEPLGMSSQEAALGIHRVVNAQMAEGIRHVSVKRGFDPREFSLVALGGGGPIHATALAEELGISTVVVPLHPGVLSAIGMLSAPVEHEASNAYPKKINDADDQSIRDAISELDARCKDLMKQEDVHADDVTVRHYADVCYVGQSHYIQVPVDIGGDAIAKSIYKSFIAEHKEIYGHATEYPAQIINLRSVHTRHAEQMAPAKMERGVVIRPRSYRRVMFSNVVGGCEAAVWDRRHLTPGTKIHGPSIVEQPDTTTLIPPGWHGYVSSNGELVLHNKAEGAKNG